MPGEKIDRLALLILCAAGFYLFFLNAWHSIPLACALAFSCCTFLQRILHRRPSRWRCSVGRAESELMRLACLPEAEASAMIRSLIDKKYPSEAFHLHPVLKHPTATLSTGDIFSIWKGNRDSGPLVIAATCTADPRAITYTRELTNPPVAILDRRQLITILREFGPCFPNVKDSIAPSGQRFDRIRFLIRRIHHGFTLLSARHGGAKNAAIGIAFLEIYLLTGNMLYLLIAMTMLFWVGASLFQHRGKRRLFM